MLHPHPEARFQTREQMQAHFKAIVSRQERGARLIARQRELDALEKAQRAANAQKESRLVGTAEERANLSLRSLLRHVAREHGIKVSDILSRSQKRKVVAARLAAYVAVHVARPAWSTSRIGMFFDRDHTTILQALNRHAERNR